MAGLGGGESTRYWWFAKHRLLFLVDTFWHGLRLRHLVMKPFAMLRTLTLVRPVNFLTAELVQCIGALSLGYGVLSLQSLIERDINVRKHNALILAVASGAQAYWMFSWWRNGRWNGKLLPWLLVESAVALGNVMYYLVVVEKDTAVASATLGRRQIAAEDD